MHSLDLILKVSEMCSYKRPGSSIKLVISTTHQTWYQTPQALRAAVLMNWASFFTFKSNLTMAICHLLTRWLMVMEFTVVTVRSMPHLISGVSTNGSFEPIRSNKPVKLQNLVYPIQWGNAAWISWLSPVSCSSTIWTSRSTPDTK
jgi:hypothetical protein